MSSGLDWIEDGVSRRARAPIRAFRFSLEIKGQQAASERAKAERGAGGMSVGQRKWDSFLVGRFGRVVGLGEARRGEGRRGTRAETGGGGAGEAAGAQEAQGSTGQHRQHRHPKKERRSDD